MCVPAARAAVETHVCTAAAHAAVEISKGCRRPIPFSEVKRHPTWLPLSVATYSVAIGGDREIARKRVFGVACPGGLRQPGGAL